MKISDSAVQSRLNVAGFSLTLFIFMINLLLNMYNSSPTMKETAPFGWHYLSALFALGVGFTFVLLAIVLFLQAQRIDLDESTTLRHEWFFSVAQILLYLSLSQFLTSGGENLVYHLKVEVFPGRLPEGLSANYCFFVFLVGMIEIAWLALIIWAPVRFICRVAFDGSNEGKKRRIKLAALYGILLLCLMLASANVRYVKGNGSRSFLTMLLGQLVQPIDSIF